MTKSPPIQPSDEQLKLGEWIYKIVKDKTKTSTTEWNKLGTPEQAHWVLIAAAIQASWRSQMSNQIKENKIMEGKIFDKAIAVYSTNNIQWLDDCVIVELITDWE